MPAGSSRLSASTSRFTRASVCDGFSPRRMSTIPSTAWGWSSLPRIPAGGRPTTSTVATSRRYTGAPSIVLTTASSMSRSVSNSPRPRITNAMSPRFITLPPALALLEPIASTTSATERPNRSSRRGSRVSENCFSNPPKLTTSATPGVRCRLGITVQSLTVRSSSTSWSRSLAST